LDDCEEVMLHIRETHRPDFKLTKDIIIEVMKLYEKNLATLRKFLEEQKLSKPTYLRFDFTIKVN